MNKSQLIIGDLVFDETLKKFGLITNKDVFWTDTDDSTYRWDFEILYEDNNIGFASEDEIEIMNEK